MKPDVRDENLAAEIDRVAKIMLGDSNDPTSYNYKRRLNRPLIRWGAIVLYCILTLVGIVTLAFVLKALSVSEQTTSWICIVALIVITAINSKKILICFIQIYQRYAPASIRNKCRFEPSCSEYMILSLNKYGLCKGLLKGIRRLTRCNIHNGGFDYP